MPRRSQPSDAPTQAQAAAFEMLSPMLDSLIEEMRAFAKKKDGIVNDLKVKLINRRLEEMKKILASDPTAAYLDLLDEATVPQNSDAVLILGQFRAAMNQYKEKHYGFDGHRNRWFTQENPRP
jgi:hypothetical protein